MILMKFVSKVVIFNEIKKKPGGPPKEFHGPLEGRGPPVEKHWSTLLNIVFSKLFQFITVGIIFFK